MTSWQLAEWVGTHVLVFPQVQFNDYATYVSVMIGRGGTAHRWTGPRNKFLTVYARSRSSSQSSVQKLVSFKIHALSILTFVGSLAEQDKDTISAETTALQKLSAGPFHALPSAMLLRGSTYGLKIDVDGIQLTRKAARFRVAFRSLSLSTGMAVGVVVRGFRHSAGLHARVILDGAACPLRELGDVRDVLGVLGVALVVPIVLRVLVS